MFGPQETLSWLCRSSNATSCCLPRNRGSPRTSVRNPSSRSSCPRPLLRSRGNEPPHSRPHILAEPWYLWSCMNWGDVWHHLRWCQTVEKSGLFYFHCMRNLCVKNENKFYLLNHMWLCFCLPGRTWKRTASRIMVSIQWLLSALYCSLQQNMS